jgi:hypothetical protein
MFLCRSCQGIDGPRNTQIQRARLTKLKNSRRTPRIPNPERRPLNAYRFAVRAVSQNRAWPSKYPNAPVKRQSPFAEPDRSGASFARSDSVRRLGRNGPRTISSPIAAGCDPLDSSSERRVGWSVRFWVEIRASTAEKKLPTNVALPFRSYSLNESEASGRSS